MDRQLLCTCVVNLGSFFGRPLENNNAKLTKFCLVWNTSTMTRNFSCLQFDFSSAFIRFNWRFVLTAIPAGHVKFRWSSKVFYNQFVTTSSLGNSLLFKMAWMLSGSRKVLLYKTTYSNSHVARSHADLTGTMIVVCGYCVRGYCENF